MVAVWLETNRWLHIAIGSIGLLAFWVPVFTAKGSQPHRRLGQTFRYCGWVVIASALIAVGLYYATLLNAGLGPEDRPNDWAFLLFLAYLAIVTGLPLSHGIAVLRHKRDLSQLKTPYRITLAWLGIASSAAVIGWALYWRPPNMMILLALSPIGLSIGVSMLRLFHRSRHETKTWLYEHLAAMLGAGIAFHTAFAVFGANRLFGYSLEGFWQVIPWIAPAAIGIPATQIWIHQLKKA